MFFVERADDLIGIQNLIALRKLNIAGGDFAFLVHTEGKFARLVLGRLKLDALQIEHDIGDIFDHARQSGEFVLCPRNFHCGDGSAFQRGQKHASKRITHGVAVARFKRFRDKLRVSIRCPLLFLREGLWHFKPTVTNWHKLFSWSDGVVEYWSNEYRQRLVHYSITPILHSSITASLGYPWRVKLRVQRRKPRDQQRN